MANDPTPAQDPVEGLLAECLAHPEAERPSVLEQLCREHPEHADELRASLEALKGIGIDALAAPAAERFPERLGDFRLEQRLGGGGMGVVYLATQESLGRQVALKVIRPEHLFFEGARARFRREIEAVARLQHPGIVQVFTGGEADGVPYFAMERVVGCSLSDLLERFQGQNARDLTGAQLLDQIRRTLGLPDAASELSEQEHRLRSSNWTQTCMQLGLQVAEALEHAHQRGVIHRDIKPSNILLTPSGRALLLDFGISYLPESAGKLTRSGTLIGSLPYMSPEQVRGESELDHRVDVYSLGVTLYELLTLRLPYAADSVAGLQRDIVAGAAAPPRQSNREIPWDVETVCLSAMEPEPGRRYASAEELARDLRNVLLLRPIEARRASTGLRLRRWVQRHPTVSVAVVLGFLALVVIPTIAGYRIIGERNRAQREAENAQTVLGFFISLLEQSDPEASGGRDVSVRDFLERIIVDVEQIQGDVLIRARIQEYVGRVLNQLGDPNRALPLLRSATEIHLLVEGEQSDHYLSTLRSLGTAQLQSGDLESALSTFSTVHAIQTRRHGAEAPQTVPVLLDLASAQHVLGRSAEAERNLRLALRILGGPDRPFSRHAAMATQSLATLLMERGQTDEARPILKQVLEQLRAAGLELSLDTAGTLTNLALLEKHAGDLESAAEYLQGGRQTYLQLGLERHPNMLLLLNNWAQLELSRGNAQRAEQLFDEALAIARSVGDKGNNWTALVATNLAGMLFTRGQFDDAVLLFEEAHEAFHQSGTSNTAHYEQALYGLAYSHYNAGSQTDALPYLEELLPLRRERLPAGDAAVFEVARLMRDCLRAADDSVTLREMLQSVHQEFEQALGADEQMTRSLSEWLQETEG